MARAARILILGNHIPFKKELGEHREIEKRFANSAAEAAMQLRPSRVDACVVCEDFTDQDVIWLLRQTMPRAPIIVFVSRPEECSSWPSDLVDAVYTESQVDSLVVLLAKHTGLRLARHPRADVETPIQLCVQNQIIDARSIDMSLSGTGVIGCTTEVPLGTEIEVVMNLSGERHHAVAQVIRWFDHVEGRAAGLQFRSLHEGARAAITRAVNESLGNIPEQWEIDELFGGLGLESEPSYNMALRTMDVQSSPKPEFIPSTCDLELPLLREVLTGNRRDAPDWMVAFADKLTPLESKAVREEGAPDWVYNVIKVRLNLARARSQHPKASPPSVLLDEGYRVFTHLSHKAAEESGPIQNQIQDIRAAILRDLTANPRLITPVDGIRIRKVA